MDRTAFSPWWEESRAEDLAHSVMHTYEGFKTESEGYGRFIAYRNYLSLFLNRNISTELASEYLKSYYQEGFSRVPFNLVKMNIDMVQNRISKMTPRPKFLPRGGNYSLKKKAELLERWVAAQFRWMDVHVHAQRHFQDVLLYGTGVMKVWREGSKIKTERVYPGEIFVDETEGYYDCVRQLIHRRYVSRKVLQRLFPKHARALEEVGAADEALDEFEKSKFSDQVVVVEAWHLPSEAHEDSELETDGRHVIVVGDVVLVDEEWEHDDFPFVFTRWSRHPRGFFGIGLAEELTGIHLDVNYTIERINKAIELVATPQVWLESSAQIKANKITNIPGQINYYTGIPPVFQTPQAASPETYQYLQSQIARSLQISRLSENAMTNKIPSGLETGAAVQAWNDIESMGFQLVAQSYERAFVKITEWLIRLGKECYEENPKYSVVAERDKHTIEQVPWKKLDMERDSYVIEVWPVSSLPFHPSGRLDMVEKMINMGMVQPQDARELVNMPDVDGFRTLEKATKDNIAKTLEDMLDEGIYRAPEPWIDIDLAMKMAQTSLNDAQVNDVPEDRITLVSKYLRAVTGMKQRQLQATAMQTGAMSPTAPPAVGPNGLPPTAVTGGEA